MRTGFIITGAVFLVIGALMFLLPTQQFGADTTTTDGGDTNTRTSSANVNIPVGWAYAGGVIGVIFLVLGLTIPTPVTVGPRGPRGARGRVSKKAPKKKAKRRRKVLPKGTTVTKTTKTTRK